MLAVAATIGMRGETKDKFGIWPRGHLIVETFNLDHIRNSIQVLADTFKRSSDWSMFCERGVPPSGGPV